MGNGRFSKQETGDKTISSNCGSKVTTAISPIQNPNQEFCWRWDISDSDSVFAKPKGAFVLDTVSFGAGTCLALTFLPQEMFASVFYRLCKTLLINGPKGCCCRSFISRWLMCRLPKCSFPMLILLHTGRQKVNGSYAKHFPYIALADYFFQCITFSLLKPVILWMLLKIAEILCSKGIFCLVQFLMLFLLFVLVAVFVWILWVWDAQRKHSC